MARRSIEERLAQIEAQKKTLLARLSKQERAEDTRRKILLGALVLHKLEHAGDGEFSKRLREWLGRELPGFLTRDIDRKLFDDLILGPARPGSDSGPKDGVAGDSSGHAPETTRAEASAGAAS